MPLHVGDRIQPAHPFRRPKKGLCTRCHAVKKRYCRHATRHVNLVNSFGPTLLTEDTGRHDTRWPEYLLQLGRR